MRTATAYIANDASVFWSRTECEAHERLCAEVAAAIAPLGSLEVSGPRWFQHDPAKVREAQRAFLAVAMRHGNTHAWFAQVLTATGNGPCDGGYFGNLTRILDGKPWDAALGRLSRIGADGREWEQPYYMTHPEEGEGPIV